MDDAVIQHLLHINQQFYQTFAVQFAATRQRIQPGVRRILNTVSSHADLLDLGCGSGELWRALVSRGHTGQYIGLDVSQALLEHASKPGQVVTNSPHFYPADLASPNWIDILNIYKPNYIFAFAVMHHLPGESTRKRFLENVHQLLTPDGRFVHSEWQFLNSTRLINRIQPWQAAGLNLDQIDPGDYLLDWRSGGLGLRYVHHFTGAELADLAYETGFEICETFYSDGENGNLGLYQTWRIV